MSSSRGLVGSTIKGGADGSKPIFAFGLKTNIFGYSAALAPLPVFCPQVRTSKGPWGIGRLAWVVLGDKLTASRLPWRSELDHNTVASPTEWLPFFTVFVVPRRGGYETRCNDG